MPRVMDKQTMRKFEVMCLTPVRPLSAKQIRELRRRERASQAVFARYLERDHRLGQPVGKRRETSQRSFFEAACTRR